MIVYFPLFFVEKKLWVVELAETTHSADTSTGSVTAILIPKKSLRHIVLLELIDLK